MIILLDMDGVIADIETGILAAWKEKYPNDPLPNPADLTGFSMDNELNRKVYNITHTKGFFAELAPIPGALEAIDTMLSKDHLISIVTSAGITYPHAASEKYQWVAKHFDQIMHAHMIITPAKYLVKGSVLIDDMPYHYNEHSAEWEHYLFEAAHNQHDNIKPRINWENWEEVLGLKQ